jgi:hypothetical protein
MKKSLPLICPSCNTKLNVKSLSCGNCETIVSGNFDLPLLSNLNNDEQKFIIDFVKCSGSLKEMASKLGFSYPTVRNMLDDIIAKIKTTEKELKHSENGNKTI